MIRGIRWTLATTVLRRLCSLLMLFFVAKWLDKGDLGIFRTYNLLLLMLSFIASLGTESQYLTSSKRPLMNLYGMLQTNLIISTLLVLTMALGGRSIGRLYASQELGLLISFAAPLIWIEALRKVYRTTAQRALLFKNLAIAETLNVFCYSLLVLSLVYFYRFAWLFSVLFYLGNLIELFYLAVVQGKDKTLNRMLQNPFRYLAQNLANLWKNRTFLTNVSLVSLLGTYSGNAPILYLGMLIDPALLGLYYFASQLIGIPVSMLTGSILQVFYPVFAQRSRELVLQNIHRYIRMVCLLGLPLLLLFAFLFRLLIPLVFGGKWDQSITLIYYMVIIYGSSLLHHPLSGVPYICRKPHYELYWNLISLLLRIAALALGLKAGFVTAILYYSIVSGIMNLAFYVMAMAILGAKLRLSIQKLLWGLLPTLVFIIPLLLPLGSLYKSLSLILTLCVYFCYLWGWHPTFRTEIEQLFKRGSSV